MTGAQLISGRVRRPNCPHCGVPKTSENCRTRIVHGRHYFANYCRTCQGITGRAYRRINPCQMLWLGARNRARRRGLDFTLSVSDIIIPVTCPALGIPIHCEGGARTDHTPSLDQIIPSKGYTPGNVCVISWRANRLKSDATPEELRLLADYTYRQTPGM